MSWLLFITRYDRCGTQVQFSGNYVEYSNSVILKRKGESDITSREHQLVIPVKCNLKNSGESSINFDTQEVSLIGDAVESDGNFSFALDMYQEGNFTLPYGDNDYPVVVDIGQTIYLGAHVTSYTEDVKLYIDSCVATTSSDKFTSPRYDLIQYSCPSDDTTSFAESRGDNKNVYFQLDTFRFVQGEYLVYVHCEMTLCNATDPTCTRTCGQRNRRSPMKLFGKEKLSKGPLFLRQVDSEINEASQAKSSTITEDHSSTLLITAMFFAMNFILIAGIAVYVVKQSQPVQTNNHYQPLLQDIE
ncbi:ZP domain-containing protein-like [Anneissia japonica]|uniref:ZP domain-containing protein-like n=1 Tax=Anneissia japonica TaxID=1529436 RepID=UPI001425B422|nr:ZP domain-containing protein-like [Anneissia japonica]